MNFWRKALKIYTDGEGWLFKWIYLENIPWAFCYLALAQRSLYGQEAKVGGLVYEAIKNKCGNDAFSESHKKNYVYIKSSNGTYLPPITLRFYGYEFDNNNDFIETMHICLDYNRDEEVLMDEIITLDQKYFRNLLDFQWKYEQERWRKLSDMAKEVMKEDNLIATK